MISRNHNYFPLVSIITPSFNQGIFIEETIISIKKQNYSNTEHIIIDGGSTDQTIQIIKKHEDTYNMRWISEPDHGHADAINKGFSLAKGDIVGWLNSDDVYFDHNTITTIVKVFEEKQDADVLYGDVVYINDKGVLLRAQCLPKFSYNRLMRWCFIEQPAVFLRSKITKLEKLDVSIDIIIDYEYWLRIGKKYCFHHVPIFLAADRNHSERISIIKKDELKKANNMVKKQYGQTYNYMYFISNYLDKCFSGLPRRIKGFIRLFLLLSKDDYAFDLRKGNYFIMMWRQLFVFNNNDML